jgi:hypothetical protein
LHSDLYQAILARRSVRRYEKEPLEEATLVQVREIVARIKPLISANHFTALMRNVSPDEDVTASLGGYGWIVNPPHYLAPYMTGEEYVLEDLGYRVEQIAVRLTALGVGTCYFGSLGREAAVRTRFGLPEGARIGAFLIFGRPSGALSGRLVNALMHRAAGAANKLPARRIFFQDSFDAPAKPPTDLAPLIEAGRHAPSALNAQPWRFLGHGERLYLFVKRRNPRYGVGAKTEYRLYDGGICMANVALALEALGMEGGWQMLAQGEVDVPDCPPNLQPMARLILQGSRQRPWASHYPPRTCPTCPGRRPGERCTANLNAALPSTSLPDGQRQAIT